MSKPITEAEAKRFDAFPLATNSGGCYTYELANCWNISTNAARSWCRRQQKKDRLMKSMLNADKNSSAWWGLRNQKTVDEVRKTLDQLWIEKTKEKLDDFFSAGNEKRKMMQHDIENSVFQRVPGLETKRIQIKRGIRHGTISITVTLPEEFSDV